MKIKIPFNNTKTTDKDKSCKLKYFIINKLSIILYYLK